MSDPIDRQAAIDALCGECQGRCIPCESYPCSEVRALESVPSAQPKTIRCKECKHQIKEWRDDKRLKDKGYWVYGCKVISDICGYWALFGQDDDFCSEAERRTDEGD